MSNIAGIGNNVTEFDTGAVRDIQEEKGRCDLMPLGIIGSLYGVWYANYILGDWITSENTNTCYNKQRIFRLLDKYIYNGNTHDLYCAICEFIIIKHKNTPTDDEYSSNNDIDDNTFVNTLLEVSMHYKNGTLKYGERNWEKGIPLHSYIDSATRHFLKYIGGYDDERHDLAFIWNLLCCAHTQINICNNKLRDLPFSEYGESTATNLGWEGSDNESENK